MTVALLFAMIGAALAGAIAHEIAHWAVWKLAGRNPAIDMWGLEVRPRSGPPTVTTLDRAAAAAPYIMGLVAVMCGVLWLGVLPVVFGLAAIQIPSRVDVEAMLGRVKWSFEA